jgi:hypothetical protein
MAQAQRAIRERTRAQIDRLNDRIAELEGSDHYQERLAAMRHKDLIQSEMEEMKRKLTQVMSILQPLLGNNAHRLDGWFFSCKLTVSSRFMSRSRIGRARAKRCSPCSLAVRSRSRLSPNDSASCHLSSNIHTLARQPRIRPALVWLGNPSADPSFSVPSLGSVQLNSICKRGASLR